jgi:alkanesulfonate monooxygenase SsuD/methylene tetrahydromethanopterin reductase-like flavin-dependent oxidoreductase (luciferase family)
MRFGLSLPQYDFSLPSPGPIGFGDTAAWARRAEDLGFDSIWVSDHFFYSFGRYGADPAPIGSLEAMTTLAALASATERVRLGTLVLCATFRQPALLAKAAATIDVISNGRVDVGLGAGWLGEEFSAFGLPFGTVGERFGALEDVTRQLASMFAGTTPSSPRPVQDPIPLWLGGKGGPRLLRLAASHASGWNVVWRMTPEAYADKVADVRAACESAGRDPATFGCSVGLYGLNGDDEAQARSAFERGRSSFPGGAMAAETWESWRADTLSGSPQQILERVGEFEALGVRELVLAPWVLPFAIHDPEQVERFAERVIAPLRA